MLFAAFHSDYAIANREVARIVASRPEQFWGFAFVDPDRDRGRIGTLVATAVNTYGFCGIKVHRHDARITREVCEAALAFSIPVLYDVMGEIAVVELLAREYPQVQFVIPHLGSFADDWRAQSGLIDFLVRHPNVYTDTSGVRRFDILEEAVGGPARTRCCWFRRPWLHPGLELAKVRLLGLPAAEERLIFGGNAVRLLAGARQRRGIAVRRFADGRPPVARGSLGPAAGDRALTPVTPGSGQPRPAVPPHAAVAARVASPPGARRRAGGCVLFGEGEPDGQVPGRGADLAQRQPSRYGIANALLEPVVARADCGRDGGSLVLGNVADGDRAGADVAIGDASHQLPQLADIAGVVAGQEERLHVVIELGRGAGAEATEEMTSEREDVVAALTEARQV